MNAKYIALILLFSGVGLLSSQFNSVVMEAIRRIHQRKIDKAEKKLEDIFVPVDKKKLFFYYTFGPLVLAGLGFIAFRQWFFGLAGALIGLWLPTFVVKRMEQMRRQKFESQLVDALMILSSALKGGLSFLQAVEVLVEDMAAPMSEEFSLVLRENKMGIPLEESLNRLNKKMQIEELEMMINSVILARETGGDITRLFKRLATTIRDNRKLRENIKTLTLQGRMQGIIMSALPIIFIMWVTASNRHHFDIMLQNELGRMLLFAGIFLQVTGMVLIKKFSKLTF